MSPHLSVGHGSPGQYARAPELCWRHPGGRRRSIRRVFLEPGSRSDVQCYPGSHVIDHKACCFPLWIARCAPLTTTNLNKSIRPRVPRLQISTNLISAPRVLIFHMRSYVFAILVIQIIKESSTIQKFANIDQTAYKNGETKPASVQLQNVFLITTGRCRSADLAVAGVRGV